MRKAKSKIAKHKNSVFDGDLIRQWFSQVESRSEDTQTPGSNDEKYMSNLQIYW